MHTSPIPVILFTQELSCSLKRTNPHLRLIIYTVPGDLDTVVLRHAGDLGEIRYWDDLRFPSNSLDGRYVYIFWVCVFWVMCFFGCCFSMCVWNV